MTKISSNSTSFEDSKSLLEYLAYKCSQRLYALGFHDADKEDLYQDGCVVYARAVKSYDPSSGVPFNAYLRRAVLLEFNNNVQRRIEIRDSLNIIDVTNAHEHEDIGTTEYLTPDENSPAFFGSNETVEDLAVRSDETRERIASLSPMAKLFVRELISPSAPVLRTLHAMQAQADFAKTLNQNIHRPKEVNVKVIRKHYGVDREQYGALKTEFLMKLGVKIGNE